LDSLGKGQDFPNRDAAFACFVTGIDQKINRVGDLAEAGGLMGNQFGVAQGSYRLDLCGVLYDQWDFVGLNGTYENESYPEVADKATLLGQFLGVVFTKLPHPESVQRGDTFRGMGFGNGKKPD
jgi:hypothetical protein